MEGREELELLADGATRAAVLAATMSCCSSEYLLLQVLNMIIFILIYSGSVSVLGGVCPLLSNPVSSNGCSVLAKLSSQHSLACSSSQPHQSCENWPIAILLCVNEALSLSPFLPLSFIIIPLPEAGFSG